MTLPFQPPIAPMLAKLADEIPTATGGSTSPSGTASAASCSATATDLELVVPQRAALHAGTSPSCSAPLLAALPDRCVVDGEIVIAAGSDDRGLDFDALLQRIHPAESRVNRLAAETPASFVAFDLLALGDGSLLDEPLPSVRHAVLSRRSIRGRADPST